MDTAPDNSAIHESDPKKVSRWMIAIGVIILIGFLAVLAQGLRMSGRGPLQEGDTLPAFELSTFDNRTIKTGDLAGKVIVINFWASWCLPCEQEAVELESAWEKYGPDSEVVFLGVAYMDIESEAEKYLSRFKISYPNGPDLRSSISKLFHVRGVPETFIFDRAGKLAHYHYGPFLTDGEITSIIDELVR